jgi:hypothetical protein
MELTKEQALSLVVNHYSRVIVNMDRQDLESYAILLMTESFMSDGKIDVDAIDVDAVVEELIDYEGGELDAAAEFLIGLEMPAEFIDKHCPA